MKFALKSIVAAVAFVAAGVASAANVTVAVGDTFNGLTATGSGVLSFSADLRAALDAGGVSVAAYGAATATATQDEDGLYTEVSASAPITSLTIDSATGVVQSALTTGGATQTAPKSSVATGGFLTVTDLNVDLTNKKVYATIIGGNGVGTLSNFYLWDISSISGATTVTGAGTYVTSITGLTITTAGYNTFVQALGLLKLGKAALTAVTDYGVITSTITATAVPTTTIPEPSTYALMGLGLVGISLVARRRAK